MGKLSDILAASNGGNINDLWKSTAAANDFGPLPPGLYVCRLASGELRQAKTGTPEYVLTFKVLDGEHKGRQVWHSLYLTPAALPMAKRDLGKIGMTSPEQMEQPIPKGIRCRVHVTLRKDDSGAEHNRVRSFDAIGRDPQDVDPFAPLPMNPSGATNTTGLPPVESNQTEEDDSGRLSFDPSKY